ncbi:MAG: porin [Pseudomonadota bacterium]
MKKLLITSALVVAGGAAFADGHVSVGGFAEIGIANNGTDSSMHQDLDVNFSLSGETDNGLSFGASMDLDEAADLGASGSDQSTNGAVFISGDFGTLTMGDTDGAFDWALTEVAMGTAIADDHTTSNGGYSGNSGFDSGNVLRYNHTIGDFSFALSWQDERAATLGTVTVNCLGTSTGGACTGGTSTSASGGAAAMEEAIGVGVKYSADLGGTTLGIGLGYQEQGDADIIGISLSAGFSGIDAVVNYSEEDDGAGTKTKHSAIGLGYTMDALLLHVNYGELDVGGTKTTGFGAVVNYDLGGGAVVALGYGSSSPATGASTDTWSLGVRMDF